MPISALSDSTVRLLGSPLVVTSPVALVKELIDNSIDAYATSVEILVSVNTIDKIEVRDNGHGIHPDDFDSLGRRGHTSKLRTFEELESVAGTSLGFRGEALASANALGTVKVTTKMADSPIATVLHLVPSKGGVAKQERASAPVGTTVCIAGLFEHLPVRQQVAKKVSISTIGKIKELLCSYALARPQLRLSLQVISKLQLSWSYAPRQTSGIREAVLQLFGTNLTSQCQEEIFLSESSHSQQDKAAENQPTQFTFEAFLPKPGADPAKLAKGSYFSVDSRPVKATRGTMKKLLAAIRTAYLRCIPPGRSEAMINDVFIRVNIKCPPGSYDANIEPLKDDVLFFDEPRLLELFDNFCGNVYSIGKRLEQDSLVSTACKTRNRVPGLSEDLGLSLCNGLAFAGTQSARQIPFQTANELHITNKGETVYDGLRHQDGSLILEADSTAGIQNHRKWSAGGKPTVYDSKTNHPTWAVNMSADLDPMTDDNPASDAPLIPSSPSLSGLEVDAGSSTRNPMEGLNPWSIARMNAPQTRPGTGRTTLQPSEHQGDGPAPGESLKDAIGEELRILRPQGLASGDLDVPRHCERLCVPPPHNMMSFISARAYRSPVSSPNSGNTELLQISHPYSRGSDIESSEIMPSHRPGWSHRAPRASDLEALGSGRKTKLPSVKDDRRQYGNHRNTQAGFDESPINESTIMVQARLSGTRNSTLGYSLDRLLRDGGRGQSRQLQGDISNQQHRPADDSDETLRPLSMADEPTKVDLPASDPRRYLMRRQRSMASSRIGKSRSLQTSLLPLETASKFEELQNLEHIITLQKQDVLLYARGMARYDRFIATGREEQALALEIRPREITRLQRQAEVLLSAWSSRMTGKDLSVEVDIQALLNKNGVSV